MNESHNVFHHRAGQTTERVRVPRQKHTVTNSTMPNATNVEQVRHEGRLLLTLQAFDNKTVPSLREAARTFTVNFSSL